VLSINYIKVMVFCVIVWCSVRLSWRFGETCCLLLQGNKIWCR